MEKTIRIVFGAPINKEYKIKNKIRVGMYFVFDMDETLAELYSVYYFIASLKLHETALELHKRIPYSLKLKLDKAYSLFVRRVLLEEISNHPLGILRPGILDVMMELFMLKRKGIIDYVIIYSNNSHLESLEFIRDLIHEYVGVNDLIKDCIHWNHPMRGEEKRIGAGYSNKTWSVLKNIMIKGNCKVPDTIQPYQVHFFDDLEHKNLKQILQDNYHQVPAYKFKASFDRITDIYRNVIQEAKVDVGTLLEYIIQLLMEKNDMILIDVDNEMDSIIEMFQEKTGGTADKDKTPPLWDSGVNSMMEVVKKVEVEGIPVQGGPRGGFRGNGGLFRRKTKRKRNHRGTANRKRRRSS